MWFWIISQGFIYLEWQGKNTTDNSVNQQRHFINKAYCLANSYRKHDEKLWSGILHLLFNKHLTNEVSSYIFELSVEKNWITWEHDCFKHWNQVKIKKKKNLETKVIYQNWVFFLFEILQLVKGELLLSSFWYFKLISDHNINWPILQLQFRNNCNSFISCLFPSLHTYLTHVPDPLFKLEYLMKECSYSMLEEI